MQAVVKETRLARQPKTESLPAPAPARLQSPRPAPEREPGGRERTRPSRKRIGSTDPSPPPHRKPNNLNRHRGTHHTDWGRNLSPCGLDTSIQASGLVNGYNRDLIASGFGRSSVREEPSQELLLNRPRVLGLAEPVQPSGREVSLNESNTTNRQLLGS